MNSRTPPQYLVLNGGDKIAKVIALCSPMNSPVMTHNGKPLYEDIFERVTACHSQRKQIYHKMLSYTYEIMSGLYDFEGSVSDDLSPAILELALQLQPQLDELGAFNTKGEMQYQYYPMPIDFPDIILKRRSEP